MKRLICTLLSLCMCFCFASCNSSQESSVSSNTSSQEFTVSYIDIAESKYVAHFNQNEFDKRVYVDCDITIGDIQTKYTAAKSGDCVYIKYINADETVVLIRDGINSYLLDEDAKTATVIDAIASSYASLLLAFDSEQLDRFYETGSESINDVTYTYETFVTDGGYCKYYLDENNMPVYMHNWNTGTSDNVITKITFLNLHNEPDVSLFELPEDYEIVNS